MRSTLFGYLAPLVGGTALTMIMLLTGGVVPTEALQPLSFAADEHGEGFNITSHPNADEIQIEPGEHLQLHITCKSPHEASMMGMAWKGYPVDAYGQASDYKATPGPSISHDWVAVFAEEGEYRIDALCYDATTGWYEETTWTVYVEPTMQDMAL